MTRRRTFHRAIVLGCLTALACSSDAPGGASVEIREPASTGLLVPEAADVLRRTRPNVLVLDVRTEEEYEEGHLPGATRIHVDELDDVIDDGRFPADAGQPILVYCQGGTRSSRAAGILADRGYTEVFDVVGGLEAWREADLPVER